MNKLIKVLFLGAISLIIPCYGMEPADKPPVKKGAALDIEEEGEDKDSFSIERIVELCGKMSLSEQSRLIEELIAQTGSTEKTREASNTYIKEEARIYAVGEMIYTGERDENGLPHGRGIALYPAGFDDFPAGVKYDGQWEHGEKKGMGTLTAFKPIYNYDFYINEQGEMECNVKEISREKQ
jgi:hypothetical protein